MLRKNDSFITSSCVGESKKYQILKNKSERHEFAWLCSVSHFCESKIKNGNVFSDDDDDNDIDKSECSWMPFDSLTERKTETNEKSKKSNKFALLHADK